MREREKEREGEREREREFVCNVCQHAPFFVCVCVLLCGICVVCVCARVVCVGVGVEVGVGLYSCRACARRREAPAQKHPAPVFGKGKAAVDTNKLLEIQPRWRGS